MISITSALHNLLAPLWCDEHGSEASNSLASVSNMLETSFDYPTLVITNCVSVFAHDQQLPR